MTQFRLKRNKKGPLWSTWRKSVAITELIPQRPPDGDGRRFEALMLKINPIPR